MKANTLTILALFSLGLTTTLPAQAQTAASATQAVYQDAQRGYCTVTPVGEMTALSLNSNRRLVLHLVDGDRDPEIGCNYGSGTGHFRISDVVKTGNRWRVADADVLERIQSSGDEGINARFINRIALGHNGTLLIEAQEMSNIGNAPGQAYRYTVRLSDWKLIQRQAIR